MRLFPAFVVLLLAGCSAVPKPAPRPAPRPIPVQTQAPRPTPLAQDWRDWPYTPGDWVYRQDARGSIALFGLPGADAAFTIRCDTAANAVYLSRAGSATGATAMTIRTSTMLRTLPAQPTGGTPAYIAAAVQPRDSLLEAIGFSRGRFVVEQAGYPTLVIPSWAEIERVTEDCRR
ncbi:hypothetical protein [Sphingomonas endolithica]|uniref:hypothetical protein n=1 Tax=Sphingomonas endolithica TaxID=2972485 RepID=UPI0021B065D2|nr:hypothetical protein [Sphingomonas sp. ZFBP2030]